MLAFIPGQIEKKPEEKPDETKDGEPPLVVNADEVGIEDGKILFTDLFEGIRFKTLLEKINFKVLHFSNVQGNKTAATLALQTDAGEIISAEAEFSLDPLLSEGVLDIKKIPIKRYAPYYDKQILFDIKDGLVDFGTRYRLNKTAEGPNITLDGIDILVNSMRLRNRGEDYDFAKIPDFKVTDGSFDVNNKKLIIGNIFTTGDNRIQDRA